jgi:hypothetical protein
MVQVFGIEGKLFPTTGVQYEDNKVISKKDKSITIVFKR